MTPGLGSSDAPSIFGCGFKTPYRLWLESSGLIERVDETSEIMDHGTLLQSVVLQALVARLNQETERQHLIWKEQHTQHHRGVPWMRATPDGLLLRYDRETDREMLSLVEVKCVVNQPPVLPRVSWLIQALYQRLVFESWHENIEAQYIACFGGLRLVWWEVPRHPDAMWRVLKETERFKAMVETGTPPPLKAEDATLLAKQWPWSVPKSIDLPDEAETWDREYVEGGTLRAQGEEMRDLARARLMQALGEAEEGHIGGVWYTARTQRDGKRPLRRHGPTGGEQ